MDASDNCYFDYDDISYVLDERRPDEYDHIESYRLDSITNEIINRLKSVGIQIMRYDSYSTNSIYLKLDNGVCNSLRISDHEGKEHLNYRYNLLVDVNTHLDSEGKYPRYYYNINDYLFLIDKIICDRDTKFMKAGAELYQLWMDDAEYDHKNDKRGFWSSAYKV